MSMVGRLINCRHVGCRLSYKTRVQRNRHEKLCSKPVKEQVITKSNFLQVDGKYICKHCSKKLKYTNNFSRHQKNCKGNPEEKTLKCPQCENGFWRLSCIDGKCKVCCKKSKPLREQCMNDEIVKYYQFEVVETNYTNHKTGEIQKSSRCERVDHEASYDFLFDKLMNIQHSYLFHRFQVCNDNFEWKNILLTVPNLGPIFHLDFSENITNTSKFEPQSAHFSKKQFSLHCSVMHSCSQDFPQYQYFDHFSDVIRHNFYFSITVIKDLLTYIENLDMDIYRFKSDNCSVQYKCRYFFPLIRSIAIEKIYIYFIMGCLDMARG